MRGIDQLVASRSAPQRLVLRSIGHHERISAGALAEVMHTDPSSLTGQGTIEAMVDAARSPLAKARVAIANGVLNAVAAAMGNELFRRREDLLAFPYGVPRPPATSRAITVNTETGL